MKPVTTPDLIRAALQHIPANLARDEWARVAMAIKSEFADDTGRELLAESAPGQLDRLGRRYTIPSSH